MKTLYTVPEAMKELQYQHVRPMICHQMELFMVRWNGRRSIVVDSEEILRGREPWSPPLHLEVETSPSAYIVITTDGLRFQNSILTILSGEFSVVSFRIGGRLGEESHIFYNGQCPVSQDKMYSWLVWDYTSHSRLHTLHLWIWLRRCSQRLHI